MVYFLGRDVDVYMFCETQATTANGTIGTSGSEVVNGAATLSQTFATAMASGGSASNTLADFARQADITGVDVSVGATDEDITYIGQMATGSVEIKKEATVTLTRKKSNNCWDVIFNGPINSSYMEITSQNGGARWGHGSNSSSIGAGLENPKDVRAHAGAATQVGFGYRVAIVLKSGSATDGTTETMTLPNLVLKNYTVTLNADGVTEESLEMSTTQSARYSIGTEYNYTLTNMSAF
tara:strand:+ start:714 stop:1427 length:714 start_codon:yes stop_codon:yes gene_type:complete